MLCLNLLKKPKLMRLFGNFILIIGLLLIYSCAEQDEFERQKLIGTWENSFYSESLNLDHVKVYYFGNNGNYINYTGFKVPGGSNFLGYTMYLEGTYTLSGNTILLKEEKRLANLGHDTYTEKENLTEIEKIGEIPGSLAFKEKGSVLEITIPCSDLLSSICIPSTNYNRLNTISHF